MNGDSDLVADSRGVLAHHARSFNLAGHFLPGDCRDDAAVVYALCRLIDDTADEAPDPVQAEADLQVLRQEVVGDREARPLVALSLEVLQRGGVDRQPIVSLLDGVCGDLGRLVVEDDRMLLRYCYRVAGTVGLMMCAVLRVHDPRAHAFAIDLGIGMQLSNLCRDVLEDAGRERVYLPADRLRRAGTSSEALLEGRADPAAVATVVEELLDLADTYYESAREGMRYIPARARVAIFVASRVYRAIGTVLRRRNCDALQGRVSTSIWDKAVQVGFALVDFTRSLIASPGSHEAGLHWALSGLSGANIMEAGR